MKRTQEIICLFGRIFISLFFILSAMNKVFEWRKAELCFSGALSNLQSYCGFSPGLQKFFSVIGEWAFLILVVLTTIELLGGLLVFFGIKARLGSVLLILFFIPITVLMHHFWFLEGFERELQLVCFLKNIAIIGGLLYILALGVKHGEERPVRLSSSLPQQKIIKENKPKSN